MTCPGVPFAMPCCEEHDEEETREAAVRALHRFINARRMAAAAGVDPGDMAKFLTGHVSLTPHARQRLRDALPGMVQP